MTNSPYNSAPVFVTPPKKPVRVHPVLAGVIALVALVLGVGFGASNTKPTAAVPAPTVSVTATATTTVTATKTVTAAAPAAQKTSSVNVLAMEQAFSAEATADQETIRSPWREAKGTPSAEAYVLSVYLPIIQKSIPSFTEAELREFLDWTLTH